VIPSAAPLLANRYRLDHELYSDSTTQVWRGTDVLLDRAVMVRVLLDAGEDAPARFRIKAQLTGAVSHRGITRVYDFEDSRPGHPAFLVTEYVEGASLAQVITSGPMRLTDALDIVTQAAAALFAVHRAGLRHGAVKPTNVLVNRDGTVKLTDFGGTPMLPYRAPELASGSPASVQGDIYGIGVIAQECLGGAACELAEAAALFSWMTDTDPRRRPASAEVVATCAAKVSLLIAQYAARSPRSRKHQAAPALAAPARPTFRRIARAAAPPRWPT
jgi:eukaryotic-like serine/threonine-protein kinase